MTLEEMLTIVSVVRWLVTAALICGLVAILTDIHLPK